MDTSRSRVPMVLLAGQQGRRHRIQDPMLAGDLVAIAAPAATSAVEVPITGHWCARGTAGQ